MGENIWMWTGNGRERLHMGGSGLKMSVSGLNMRGSGFEWVENEWE